MPATQASLDPDIAECLRQVLDPEIGLNVVDLGLVRSATRSGASIDVEMTLTSRACPLGDLVLGEAREALRRAFPEAGRVNVALVWTPAWSQDLITDRGYELLGRSRTRTLI